MNSEQLIDRYLSGEQINELIDELTKTIAIAKYPKPLALIRKTRKDKDNNESELDEFTLCPLIDELKKKDKKKKSVFKIMDPAPV